MTQLKKDLPKRELKYFRQNIVDYVITNYGNIDRLFDFMIDNELPNLQSFITLTTSRKYILRTANNDVLTLYRRINHIIETGDYLDPSDYDFGYSLDFTS